MFKESSLLSGMNKKQEVNDFKWFIERFGYVHVLSC